MVDRQPWFEQLGGASWASLWSGYVICGAECQGIRKLAEQCPACGADPLELAQSALTDAPDEVPQAAFMGAEGRYEDWIYLEMLQREWERPAEEFARFRHFRDADRPSARAALVLLFWSYFETRIERLHRTAMRSLPPRIVEDQMRRHSAIGSRLSALYKINFDTNYFDDLTANGWAGVSLLLRDLHKRRNDFAHGIPQAINDATVEALVAALRNEHEAWIAIYNLRAGPAPAS